MEFKSESEHYITGRGKVFVVKNDRDRNRDDNDLVGKVVIIDGKSYKVNGVESFALPTIKKDALIGLLVSETINEEPTESYRMVIMDMSKIEPPKAPEVKEFDIWVGWYHLGQGHHPPSEPQKVATVEATTFKIACWLHELESQAKSIRERMVQPNAYVEDAHFGSLYYDPKTNSNSWIGKYYETKEEALKTFK